MCSKRFIVRFADILEFSPESPIDDSLAARSSEASAHEERSLLLHAAHEHAIDIENEQLRANDRYVRSLFVVLGKSVAGARTPAVQHPLDQHHRRYPGIRHRR